MSPKKAKRELVQIAPSPIPPWHQSTEYLTSCAVFYAEAEIKKNKLPGGMESARGNEVHHTASSYAAYCAMKQIPMDLDAFDNLAKGAGPVAAHILSGMRESFRVDWEHLIATELPMSLDENLRPTEVVEALTGICPDSGEPAHYSGTLDALYGFREELRAEIVDFKTHPRPFDPADTLQAKTYTVFVLTHFPWVQTVTFRLVFVRWQNLTRAVTYSRQDLPTLIDALKSARERQKMIHADYDAGKTLEAVAGNHCLYCALLTNRKCPISQWNESMMDTPEMWLNWDLWNSQFSRKNKARMKAYVQETGKNITLKDFNQKAYIFGPQESESDVYPLFKATVDGVETDGNRLVMPVVDLLTDYAYAAPEDTAFLGKVQISSTSLKSYLKAKKRSVLDLAVDDVVEKVTKVKLAVSRPLETLPDEITDDEQDEEEF